MYIDVESHEMIDSLDKGPSTTESGEMSTVNIRVCLMNQAQTQPLRMFTVVHVQQFREAGAR